MALLTPEEVFDLTGVEVTTKEIALAQLIIDLESDTTEDAVTAGNVSGRNVRQLKRALAFQAIWMLDHPDVLSAMDVSSVSQDGVSGQFRGDWAQYLAPLAKRHLDKLTWKLAPLRVQHRRRRQLETDLGNRNSAAHDDGRHWSAI